MFVWRDSFITLGNSYQKFNLTTQLWSLIPTSAPISLYNPGCLVLPNEEILVVGSVFYSNRTLIYNHVTNSWRNLPDTNTPQGYTFDHHTLSLTNHLVRFCKRNNNNSMFLSLEDPEGFTAKNFV
jgi:hypothetical protein